MNLLPLAVVALCLSEVFGAFKLTILHVNDMHARFDETNRDSHECKNKISHKGCYGGFARLKHAVLEARQRAMEERRASLFLNAGDNFQGTPLYTLFKWNVTSDLVNRLDLDVMTLGNHELDDGVAGLAPFVQRSKTPIVTTNVDTRLETSLQSNGAFIHKSLKIKFDSTTVCIVGYLTPETVSFADAGKLVIHPELEAISAEIRRLKESGEDKCHVIIGLGHSGFEVDKKIAAAVPEIDVIVGGHTNTFLYSGTPPDIEEPEGSYPYIVTQKSGKKVPVVQAYAFTKYLGELMIDWDDDWKMVKAVGNPILLDEKVTQDPAMAEAVEKWTSDVGDDVGQVVGTTTARLEGSPALCSCAECNLGSLVADSFVEYYATAYKDSTPPDAWTSAPISFIQAGTIRSTIDGFYSGGNITYADVITVMPFKNKLVKTSVTGEHLHKLLEFSVDQMDASCSNKHSRNRFLQVSGIHVTFDMSKPKGSRVVEARLRCGHCLVPKYEALKDNETYEIIITDFLFNGGDGFKFDEDAPKQILELTDTEVVVDYLRRKSPVYPEVSSRITVINVAPPSGSSPLAALSILLLLTALVLPQCLK